MGQVRSRLRVKYFCGLLLSPAIDQAEVEVALEQDLGPITFRSPAWPFTQTQYYRDEMGSNLTRSFVAFGPLREMADLAAVKHTTNRLEARWAGQGDQRQVNLDPGYLDLAKVILATTKDYAHRLYIGAGMYAEVTLRYQRRSYQPWEWTYPDYREGPVLAFFNQLREAYKAQLRELS